MGLHLGGIGTRITIFDQDVAAGRPSELPEPLPETLKITLRIRVVLGDSQQYGDPPHLVALLRVHRERPRHRRAAEQRDELPPWDHSITSSAIASSLSGIWRPSAFAVLRLITSSNLAGCTTGRSAGFSPLRMRPV